MSINVQWKMRKKCFTFFSIFSILCFLNEFKITCGIYNDADDLVNELDRPSEYENFNYTKKCHTQKLLRCPLFDFLIFYPSLICRLFFFCHYVFIKNHLDDDFFSSTECDDNVVKGSQLLLLLHCTLHVNSDFSIFR